MSRHIWPFVGVALSLGGCVTVKTVELPDGRPGYSIRGCDSLAQCMNLAAKRCGGPYDVVDPQSGTVVANKEGSSYKKLVFACGEAPPATDPKP
jgi:hypothetical protein